MADIVALPRDCRTQSNQRPLDPDQWDDAEPSSHVVCMACMYCSTVLHSCLHFLAHHRLEWCQSGLIRLDCGGISPKNRLFIHQCNHGD